MKHFLAFTALLLLFSCSVQKRKYQKGFYVNRINHQNEKVKQQTAERTTKKKTDSEQPVLVKSGHEPAVEANLENTLIKIRSNHHSFLSSAEDSCDVLFF